MGISDIQCVRCRTLLHLDDCWITDEGAMCKPCKDSLYGNPYHTHDWVRYESFRHVYKSCYCGEKFIVDVFNEKKKP